MSESCHCGSGKEYKDCCEPYVLGKSNAPTAESLMRSRYSAHVVCAVDYLVETTHPSQRKNYDSSNIEQWAKESDWQKLEIISTALGSKKHDKGEVEFKAHYHDKKGKLVVHHELSYFAQNNEQWYYVAGKIDPKPADKMVLEASVKEIGNSNKIGRNDPCPCGSGKKFKKCCA